MLHAMLLIAFALRCASVLHCTVVLYYYNRLDSTVPKSRRFILYWPCAQCRLYRIFAVLCVWLCIYLPQYLLDPGKGLTGAEVNQLHVHGGSALMEVRVAVWPTLLYSTTGLLSTQ